MSAEFISYRVLMRVHLPPPQEGHLEKSEVIQFNGVVLKREDGTKINLPFPSALRGAIKAKWLVPLDSPETEYRPQPSGVEVHAAQSTGPVREKITVMTVAEEETDLGNRIAIRSAANHNKQTTVESGATTMGVVSAEDSEGVVVGRFKTAAQAEPISIGKGDRKAVTALDRATKVQVERIGRVVRAATIEAHSGEGTPNGFQDDGVKVNSAGSSVGGVEEGVVVGRMPQVESENSKALENALRKWVSTGKTWDGNPVKTSDISVMVKSILRSLDVARSAPIAEPPKAPKAKAPKAPKAKAPRAKKEPKPKAKKEPKGKAESSASPYGWDLTSHWKKRLSRALNEFGGDPAALREILAFETSKGVTKAISARLEQLAPAS